MKNAPVLDPFAVFGVERRLDLDERALEKRYLQLSRDLHPDRNRAAGVEDCAAVLARAAEVNDAWRLLRDRWERARVLLETQAPGALERHKQLDADFLLDAMELAEQVSLAEPSTVPDLRNRLAAQVDAAYAALRAAFAQRDHALAARRLHESKYLRKALADLEART